MKTLGHFIEGTGASMHLEIIRASMKQSPLDTIRLLIWHYAPSPGTGDSAISYVRGSKLSRGDKSLAC